MEYQRVLITGAAGFIASNLAIYLVRKYPDSQFLGIDKLGYSSSVKNLDEIITYPNFMFEKADFTVQERMEKLFREFKPDLVLHLGAYTHVDMSFNDSLTYSFNNYIGTHILIECARKFGIKLFYYQSTDEVMGSREEISDENSIMDPSNPYSSSKSGAELLVRSYYHSFKTPVVISRGNNVFGPKQFPEKAIPKFILRLEKGLPPQIQGSGRQSRSFIYVDDFVEAVEIIILKGKVGGIYNVGSKYEVSILQLASTLSQMYGKEEKVEFVIDRPFNDTRYLLDASKLFALGFEQKVSFDEGLRRTITWYREHPDNWTPTQLELAEK